MMFARVTLTWPRCRTCRGGRTGRGGPPLWPPRSPGSPRPGCRPRHSWNETLVKLTQDQMIHLRDCPHEILHWSDLLVLGFIFVQHSSGWSLYSFWLGTVGLMISHCISSDKSSDLLVTTGLLVRCWLEWQCQCLLNSHDLSPVTAWRTVISESDLDTAPDVARVSAERDWPWIWCYLMSWAAVTSALVMRKYHDCDDGDSVWSASETNECESSTD